MGGLDVVGVTWRKAFDAVERPVTEVSDALLRTGSVMDVIAIAWKLQRSAARRVETGVGAGLRLVGVPTRGDLVEVVNQVAGLQREVRALRRESDIENG
jgi:hypothetical protein